jgi:guanosine-3',5'-bis(diphosphate) 3'-pyrophosphohydrolase
MGDAEVERVAQAVQLACESCGRRREDGAASLGTLGQIPPLECAPTVATILAQMGIDAVGVAAGVVFEAADVDRLS